MTALLCKKTHYETYDQRRNNQGWRNREGRIGLDPNFFWGA